MKRAASILAALALAAALSGCTSAPPAADDSPTPKPTPTASATAASSGLSLADALAKWDDAAAQSDGATLFAMTIAIPRAVENECASKLTADQTTWLAEKATEMTASLDAAKQPDGSVKDADVWLAGNDYVKAVRNSCA